MVRETATLFAAIDREPRRLARAHQLARVQARAEPALAEQRKHPPPGGPRAGTLVRLLGVVLLGAMREVVGSARNESLRAVVDRCPATARRVLTG